MPYVDIFWNHDDPDGNVARIAQHGLSTDDVEAVLMDPVSDGTSDSSGRPI